MLQDMKLFSDLLRTRFQGVPNYIYGLLLGSFLVREYLGRYPEGIAGAIIMGTGNQPDWLLCAMMSIVRGQIRKVGWHNSSALIQQLSFDSYNQKFKPNRTSMDWLCSDEAELDQYRSDPLCRPKISAGLFYQMLDSMRRTGCPDSYSRWDKSIPILLLSGENDPVGNMGKGVRSVYQQMKAACIQSVRLHLFPKSRHLLLNERKNGTAADAVRIILDFTS